MRFTSIALALSGAALVTAGCSTSGSGTTPAGAFGGAAQKQPTWPHSASPLRHHRAVSNVDLARACPAERLYIADYYNSDIAVFPLWKPPRATPCGYITRRVLGPSGISVGRDGSLYVSDFSFDAITVYRKNATSASRIIFTAGAPQFAYVGADGTIYSPESYSNQIEEFAPGSNKPVRTISITYPWGVATDSANNLYATSDICNPTCVGHVVKFPPRSTTGTDLGIAIGFTYTLVIGKDGSIFIGDGGNVDVSHLERQRRAAPSPRSDRFKSHSVPMKAGFGSQIQLPAEASGSMMSRPARCSVR